MSRKLHYKPNGDDKIVENFEFNNHPSAIMKPKICSGCRDAIPYTDTEKIYWTASVRGAPAVRN